MTKKKNNRASAGCKGKPLQMESPHKDFDGAAESQHELFDLFPGIDLETAASPPLEDNQNEFIFQSDDVLEFLFLGPFTKVELNLLYSQQEEKHYLFRPHDLGGPLEGADRWLRTCLFAPVYDLLDEEVRYIVLDAEERDGFHIRSTLEDLKDQTAQLGQDFFATPFTMIWFRVNDAGEPNEWVLAVEPVQNDETASEFTGKNDPRFLHATEWRTCGEFCEGGVLANPFRRFSFVLDGNKFSKFLKQNPTGSDRTCETNGNAARTAPTPLVQSKIPNHVN